MKLYSEKTKKFYDNTEKGKELLSVEEQEYDRLVSEKQAAIEKAKAEKQKLAAERKRRAEEVSNAAEEVRKAQKKYNDLLKSFIKDYGAYHTSYTRVTPLVIDSANLEFADAFFKEFDKLSREFDKLGF